MADPAVAIDDDSIGLVLPGGTRFIRVARLVASGVASMIGFDLDGVEDLRIAVDELCASLVEASDGSPIDLRFTIDGNAVVVIGSTRVGPTGLGDADRRTLSDQILGVVCDEYELAIAGDQVTFRLRKQAGAEVPGGTPG